MHSGSGRRNSERILGCTLTKGCGHNRTENFGNLITAPCGLLLKVSSEGGCGRSGSQCAQPQLAAAGRRKRRRKREAQRGAGGPYGCFLLWHARVHTHAHHARSHACTRARMHPHTHSRVLTHMRARAPLKHKNSHVSLTRARNTHRLCSRRSVPHAPMCLV